MNRSCVGQRKEVARPTLRGLELEFGEDIFIRRPALFAREMADAVGVKVYREWRLDGTAKSWNWTGGPAVKKFNL
jgi:hypothetical protein